MNIASEGKRQSSRHLPQRTCIGCRGVKPKRELVRVVRDDSERARVDLSGRAPGRGVYICREKSCWQNALKGQRLDRALRMTLPADDRRELAEFGDTLGG